jgi:hypothetical protein
VAADLVPGGVRVPDVGDALGGVDTVVVVAVEEERGFGTGVGEEVGNGAEVVVWPCTSLRRRKRGAVKEYHHPVRK